MLPHSLAPALVGATTGAIYSLYGAAASSLRKRKNAGDLPPVGPASKAREQTRRQRRFPLARTSIVAPARKASTPLGDEKLEFWGRSAPYGPHSSSSAIA